MSFKAGFAHEDTPKYVFPLKVLNQIESDENYSSGGMDTKVPLKHGIVTDWDAMEKIWKRTFKNELRVQPEDHRVMLIDAPLASEQQREMATQIMFETFTVSAAYILNSCTASMFATGSLNGCVLEIGHGLTSCVPVCVGRSLQPPADVSQRARGGSDLTDYLTYLIQSETSYVKSARGEMCVKAAKETLCFVSLDPSTEPTPSNESFFVPDGTRITLSEERWKCPEALFDVSKMSGGSAADGIHELIHNTISHDCCNEEIRPALYGNVVLSGGSTLFPGLQERLEKELRMLAPRGTNVNVVAPPNRQHWGFDDGAVLLPQKDTLRADVQQLNLVQ